MRTLKELLPLREPAPHIEVPPRIADVRIVSGRMDQGTVNDGVLAGKTLFHAVEVRLPKRYWRPVVTVWQWREIGAALRVDRDKWPTWDGISDGDPVTRGHLEALREGGLL